MKKIICAVLVLTVLFSLAACGKKKQEGTLFAYTDENGNIVTEYHEQEETLGREAADDEVKVTMPLVFLDEKYRKDIKKYCEDFGYIEATVNEKKQTVTVIMRALSYDLNLVKIGTTVMRNIGDTIDSGEYPYVKGLDSYSSNFDEIVMLVDGEGYKKDAQHGLLPYFLGECGMYYQIFTTENEYHCTVKIKDEKTGEIIDEKYYETDNTGKEY